MLKRRSNFVAPPLGYVEVGASKAEDLLRFPPNGATVFEESLMLGVGAEVYIRALSLLMTLHVYGTQIQVQQVSFANNEISYAENGEPFVAVGDRVKISNGKKIREWLVVQASHTSREARLMLGSVGDSAPSGEYLFMLIHNENDEVFLTVRGFFHPGREFLAGKQVKQQIVDTIAVLGAVKSVVVNKD